MRKEFDGGVFNCVICKENKQYYSIGNCEHKSVCNICCLRSRILYKDQKCPICTTKLEEIYIFDIDDDQSFYEIVKNKEYFYKDDDGTENGIYYSTMSAKEEALKLKSFICPIKSCHDGVFENFQILSTHLNKVHKRYYCDNCLKDGKRFLSEMQIFTYNALSEHKTYGEYSETGVLLISPHPTCPFCTMTVYNEEFLFKHLNENHFICQLCRDHKNIIFYKEVSHLLDHNKMNHYVCPYQECLEDIFVVFDSDEKLNSHLITKHKCTDAQNKLLNFNFGSGKKKTESSKYSKAILNDEFNFTQFVNDLKERVKQYSDNYEQRTHYVKNNNPEVERYYQNNYYKDSKYDEYSKYEKTGKKNKPLKYDDYFNIATSHNKYYDDNYNYYNEDNYYGYENEYNYNQTNQKSKHKKNKKGDTVQKHEYARDNYKYSNKQEQINTSKQSHSTEHASTMLSNTFSKTDYSFIFNGCTKILREYVSKKIHHENPKVEEFLLHRETIYQLIIIIDKLDNQKLLQLSNLSNFGIDLEIYKELKNLISVGNLDTDKIYSLLNKLELRHILIIYKYFSIASKKFDGLFYKLEFEQINPDLYDDFGIRENKTKIKRTYELESKADKNSQGKLNSDFSKKLVICDNNFSTLPITKENSDDIIYRNKKDTKLKSMLNDKEKEVIKDKKITQNPDSELNSNLKFGDNKLTMLLENKAIKVENKKASGWNKKKLDKKNINYDEEFPEL